MFFFSRKSPRGRVGCGCLHTGQMSSLSESEGVGGEVAYLIIDMAWGGSKTGAGNKGSVPGFMLAQDVEKPNRTYMIYV